MSRDSLHERGQALEDQFFRDRDRQLMDQLKSKMQAEQDRSSLSSAAGIDDPAVLDHLVAQGIRAETLASVGLIPLIAVAWADGSLDPRERDAVLRAAEQSNITPEQPAYNLIKSWLQEPPAPALLSAWKEYVQALHHSLDATSFNQIRQTILARAKKVAESAGGFLGLGSISAEERQVLEDLERAFGPS